MVQQVAGLKARVMGGLDPLAPQQLVNLLVSLTGCLSLLRECLHGELLGQVLGISLWACPEVRRVPRGFVKLKDCGRGQAFRLGSGPAAPPYL